MADFPTITDTISYRSENQFVCSVSDKLDGFLHRAHEFEFSNLWLVASPGDQKRLRQARQEDSVRNEANYVLLLKLGERATDRFKLQTEKNRRYPDAASAAAQFPKIPKGAPSGCAS